MSIDEQLGTVPPNDSQTVTMTLPNLTLYNNESSSNATSVSESVWENVLMFVATTSIAAPGILINVVVGLAIVFSNKLRNEPIYMTMVVLAVMDIGHALIDIVPVATGILLQRNIPNYENRLYFVNLIYPTWYITCLSYITIALHRLCAFYWPHLVQQWFTRRNVLLLILVAFPVLTTLMMLPMLSGLCCPMDFSPSLWLIHYEDGRDLEYNYQTYVCYTISITTSVVGIVCYIPIIHRVHTQRRQIKGTIAVASTTSKKRMMSEKADMKLTIQFTLLTVIFTVTSIVLHYEANLGPMHASRGISVLTILGYALMSVMNPFIYLTMNQTLRDATKELVTCAAVACCALVSRKAELQLQVPAPTMANTRASFCSAIRRFPSHTNVVMNLDYHPADEDQVRN